MKKRAVVLAVLALVACKSQGPGVSDVIGVYAVETYDGQALPRPAAQGTVVGDTLRMNSNLSYTHPTWIRPPGGAAPVTLNDNGTWTLDGNVVHFVSAAGSGSFDGQWSGGRMLVVTNVHTYVYQKL